MCGVASQPREWAHSKYCLRTQPWLKNGTNTFLREQLLPPIQEQFSDEQSLFQHDGAPWHKAKGTTKWLREQNIDILGPWPGNSPDLNPIENLRFIIKAGGQTKTHKFWQTPSIDYARIQLPSAAQKLIDSMPGQIAEVLKNKGQHLKYWLFASTSCNCQ